MTRIDGKISFFDLLGTPSNVVFIIGGTSVITQFFTNFIKYCKENIWIAIFTLIILITFLYFSYKFLEHQMVRNKVKNFYHRLDIKEYIRAWSLLSKKMKSDRWNNEYDRFENGYVHNQQIRVFGIHKHIKRKREYQFIIVYLDIVDCCNIKGIEKIQGEKIGNIDKFILFVKNLERSFDHNIRNSDIFREQRISDFFKPNFSDRLRWTYKQDHLDSIMESKRKKIEFINVKTVSLKKETLFSKYRISDISDINTQD